LSQTLFQSAVFQSVKTGTPAAFVVRTVRTLSIKWKLEEAKLEEKTVRGRTENKNNNVKGNHKTRKMGRKLQAIALSLTSVFASFQNHTGFEINETLPPVIKKKRVKY
jgi:hypothetical protein